MTFATDFVVHWNGCACSFHGAMNNWSCSANSAFEAKSTMTQRFRCRMLNHCSTWFIHEQCTGGWWKTNRGCCASHACTFLPLCIRRLSSTTWTTVTAAGISRSSIAKKALNSSWRFRSAVSPYTFPVRVSKAANSFSAPARLYSCSTRTGCPGAAGFVSALRGRGWRPGFSSTPRTIACAVKGRVYRSAISRTWAAQVASRGPFGDSHRWCRHGLRWWLFKMRPTVSEEMLSTTPSRTNWQANSWQSHCDSERPSLSGRAQAILTRWSATAGGKDGLAPTPGLVLEAAQALGELSFGPVARVAERESDGACGRREGLALVPQKQQSAPACQPLSKGGRAAPVLQFLLFAGEEVDGEGALAAAHGKPGMSGATRTTKSRQSLNLPYACAAVNSDPYFCETCT